MVKANTVTRVVISTLFNGSDADPDKNYDHPYIVENYKSLKRDASKLADEYEEMCNLLKNILYFGDKSVPQGISPIEWKEYSLKIKNCLIKLGEIDE